MFDDLKIRNKLILLLAGPIVIILLLAASGAKARLASADDSRQVEEQVSLAKASGDIVDALQHEAVASTAYVASGRKAYEPDVKAARAATDKALGASLGEIEGAGGSYSSSASLAVAAAKKLGYVRDAVDQGYRWDQVVVTYGETQDTFLAFTGAVTDAVTEPGAASELRTAATLSTYKSYLAREGAIVAAAAERGGLETAANAKLLREAVAGEEIQSTLFKSVAVTGRKEAVRNALSSDSQLLFERVRDQALEAGAEGSLDVEGKNVVASAQTLITDLHTVESNLFDAELSSSRSARSTAERSADIFLIGALVAIVGATAAAVFLGRRITRPLGRLTEAADRLSLDQMPRLIETLKNPIEEEMGFQIGSLRPIEIDSNDEIGRLAKSFNEVQRVAGEVAAEQAQLLRKGIGEMFVNLARRNQALLDRQIEFIDELERGEEDPDQLENLYRLDHLATRMRRNAESLLVLAGAEPPRRRGRPAPLANVVRAALAEVEDFGRIELLSFDEVLVASNAAADLAHLLSELMENATNFSPPETKVEVVGHKTKADGYVISITDHGIGMSGEQIVEANEALAKPPLVGLAMSRSLGFIVVGRLASRHGIAVRMMPSAAGGVTAVVSIPPPLVVDTPGGMAEAATHIEAPARLKPVLESPTSGLGALDFAPMGGSDGHGGGTAPAPAAPAPAPAAPAPDPAPVSTAGGLTRDLPAPAVFAPPVEAAPAPAPAPAPVASAPAAPAPAAPAAGMPRRTPSVRPEPAEPPAAATPAPPAAAPPAPARAPEPALPEGLPEALTFAPADDDRSPLETTVTPDFPPGPEDLLGPGVTRAPLPPSVASGHLDGAAPRSPQANRPFFLEDAEPPRPFGGDRADAPAAEAAPGPAAEAAPGPAAAAPSAPPRLFGGPSPSPAGPAGDSGLATRRPAAPAAPATAPLTGHTDTRPPAAPGPRTDTPPPAAPGARVAAPPVPSTAPAAPGSEATAPGAPVEAGTTQTGLAKRVPRKAGATRAIPGSEVERGVASTRRSPEEVRKMLASHSAGRQRARTTEPVPAGASDEREPQ